MKISKRPWMAAFREVTPARMNPIPLRVFFFIDPLSSRFPPSAYLSVSHIFCWAPRVWEVKGLMNTKIRISKHEYRNKSRMTKIPNDKVVRKAFRLLENLDLGIVSDFGFRISNLINDLTEQNKTPYVQQTSYG
jgi:hypothetical protein